MVFDSSLVWGRSNASVMPPPHHGARLMPFLFTPLGYIFMGAVLFNENLENTVGQRICLNYCPTCKSPLSSDFVWIAEQLPLCSFGAWLAYGSVRLLYSLPCLVQFTNVTHPHSLFPWCQKVPFF
jgi:hypothetical protein